MSKTVTLDGHKSHAFDGKTIVEFKWRAISGNCIIYSPGSVETKVKVNRETLIELIGIDSGGMVGRDTVWVRL